MKIILLFILSLFFECLFAQEINDTSVINWNLNNSSKEYIIAGINFRKENNYYEDDILKKGIGLLEGDRVNIQGEKITSAFKAFFKQGLFSYGKILLTKQTLDSVWIEIILHPNPIISNINFIGINKNEQEEIEAKIGMIPGSYLTPTLINRSVTRIKSFFSNRGFSNAEINIQLKNDISAKGRVIINILINKNQEIKLRHIYITGNSIFSNYTLKKIMKNTNEKFSLIDKLKLGLRKFFNSNKFFKEKYDIDIKNIILKYNEKGYMDTYITTNIVPINDNMVDIYLTVHEGKQYFIRKINWVGNTLFSSENLNSILDMQLGDVFNQKKIKSRIFEDKDAIINLYYNKGYIFTSINPVEMSIENDSIDLEIRILEGEQATINRIAIYGNDKIYENVIRRELVTKPGQVFSKKLLERSARDIAQMGHFDLESMNNIQPIPNPETGMVDINYNLTAKANDQIEASLGWRGKNGIVGSLCLKFSNFSFKNLIYLKKYRGFIPQGEGQMLTLNAQTNGNHYQSYGMSFLETWLGGKRPNSFSFSTHYITQVDSDYSANNSYVGIFNIKGGYGKRLSWPDNYFTFISDISYQHYWVPCNCSSFPIDIANNLTFGLALNRNTTDNPVYTCCGSIFFLSVNTTFPCYLCENKENYDNLPKQSSSLAKYYKWKLKSKIFIPFEKRKKMHRIPVLMNHTEYGLIKSYNQKKYKPFEKFGMGGDGMTGYSAVRAKEVIGLRGYEFDVLPLKGDRYVYAKSILELRYPFIFKQEFTAYGLLFLEVGNTWENVQLFDPFDLKRSGGVGLRIFLPMIGLVGFDWAYGFDLIDDQRKYNMQHISGPQFHFILGQE